MTAAKLRFSTQMFACIVVESDGSQALFDLVNAVDDEKALQIALRRDDNIEIKRDMRAGHEVFAVPVDSDEAGPALETAVKRLKTTIAGLLGDAVTYEVKAERERTGRRYRRRKAKAKSGSGERAPARVTRLNNPKVEPETADESDVEVEVEVETPAPKKSGVFGLRGRASKPAAEEPTPVKAEPVKASKVDPNAGVKSKLKELVTPHVKRDEETGETTVLGKAIGRTNSEEHAVNRATVLAFELKSAKQQLKGEAFAALAVEKGYVKPAAPKAAKGPAKGKRSAGRFPTRTK